MAVAKDSGAQDLILRPLSAKLLPPTKPEREGWVNRSLLLDIQGRSRQRQLDLAQTLGINDYPMPAGGCLLTDISVTRRLQKSSNTGKMILTDLSLNFPRWVGISGQVAISLW